MKHTLFGMLTTLLLLHGSAQAAWELRADFENDTAGKPPATQATVSGTVATGPSSLRDDPAAGVTVLVQDIKSLGGKSLVVADDAGDKGSKVAVVVFNSGPNANAYTSGKVFVQWDWVTLGHTTGNIGFVNLRNTKSEPLASLMFAFDTTTLTIVSGKDRIDLPNVVSMDQKVTVKVTLDLEQWNFTVSLGDQKLAERPLSPMDDHSFQQLDFSTTDEAITRFAIKNVIISPSPIRP